MAQSVISRIATWVVMTHDSMTVGDALEMIGISSRSTSLIDETAHAVAALDLIDPTDRQLRRLLPTPDDLAACVVEHLKAKANA